MACQECERLSREEIEWTRHVSETEARLQRFSPEPPFDEAVVNEFRACEKGAEESRASLSRARAQRAEHTSKHSLTIQN